MSKPTVVLTDRGWPDAAIETALCEQAGYRLIDVQAGADERRLVAAVQDADPVGLLFCWAPVSDAVLAAGPVCGSPPAWGSASTTSTCTAQPGATSP